ncbi:MAG: type II toxin-antitoxin system RelE/ParE family toxin [Hyphomicrobium sp.]|nr:type II toxin-antitoxin system RelE/ParE family toxin [Hyphomicrobium sp.]
MTRLLVAAEAEGDIDDILDYLEREAGRATAAAYAERFAAEIQRIADFPGHATSRPALGGETRVGLVYPYLLIYDYSAADEEATLLRVCTASATSPSN